MFAIPYCVRMIFFCAADLVHLQCLLCNCSRNKKRLITLAMLLLILEGTTSFVPDLN